MEQATSQNPRLQWFAGNVDALDMYERLVYIAHAWDDLIDRDKPVNINELMGNLLLHLPGNPFYRKFEGELRALMLVGMVGYMASNLMAKSRDAHKIELAHYLRYSVSGVAVFMVSVLNGMEHSAEIVSKAMPVMIPERLADYLKEHGNATPQ